jgi:orotidine-5'-phosphate decarboxylase
MTPAERIVFALDVPTANEAKRCIDILEDHVGAFKVGLELFTATGRTFSDLTRKPIVLDLKLHDIPETVARAVKAGGERGVKYMTLHVQQRRTLEMALKAAEPYGMTLLCVTVLTSMEEGDCAELDYQMISPSLRVIKMAHYAHSRGIRGFVCSPQEVGRMKSIYPDTFCMVPGIRPAGSPTTDDQKRVGTPKQAVADGANIIVVGRPIRDAADPVEAAKAIAAELT